jgi:glycosyltransferase involved in cell wall biosynthesis
MRLVMLGATPGARGDVAATLEAWRANGLFERWPGEHLAVHGDDASLRKALSKLAALMARERRVLLHAHATGACLWRAGAFAAAAAAARCPIVLQLHGSDFTYACEEGGSALRYATRLLFARAARVLVPGERLGRWVASECRQARVAHVPPPLPQAGAGAPLAERPRMVLFLGRLEARRGVFDLVEAAAAVRRDVPGLRLVFAGEGDRAALANHAQRLGIADAVKFTGWVGPSGKRALLDSAAVLASPSYEDGLPLAVLEAMAAGVPVAACSTPGVLEAVSDGVSGLLAAPGDAATLARHLRRLLLEPQTAARIGAAARESARLRYSPQRSLACLAEVYAELGLIAVPAPAPVGEPELRQAA